MRFGERMPVQTEGYTQRMERFEDSLSAFLGGPFEPSMIGFADRLETYAYVEAQSPEEAAGLAIRPFGEAAEAVWGPGTAAEVLRVVTSDERDRELDAEGVGKEVRALAAEDGVTGPFREFRTLRRSLRARAGPPARWG